MKKMIAVILFAALMLSLCACGAQSAPAASGDSAVYTVAIVK